MGGANSQGRESGGGRRKVRRVEVREKGKGPGKDEDETCLEK